MPERLPHYASLGIALLAGSWVAVSAPATPQFEQTMRALAMTGQVLAPLSLVADAGTTLLVMACVYLVAAEVLERVGRRSD